MICADTSVWVHFLQGNNNDKVELFNKSLSETKIYLSPPILSELLSFPNLDENDRHFILQLPCVDIKIGFWERVGDTRRSLLKKNLKARLADCLIAQNCLDHDLPLLTLDKDYRHFLKFGLKLV